MLFETEPSFFDAGNNKIRVRRAQHLPRIGFIAPRSEKLNLRLACHNSRRIVEFVSTGLPHTCAVARPQCVVQSSWRGRMPVTSLNLARNITNQRLSEGCSDKALMNLILFKKLGVLGTSIHFIAVAVVFADLESSACSRPQYSHVYPVVWAGRQSGLLIFSLRRIGKFVFAVLVILVHYVLLRKVISDCHVSALAF